MHTICLVLVLVYSLVFLLCTVWQRWPTAAHFLACGDVSTHLFRSTVPGSCGAERRVLGESRMQGDGSKPLTTRP